MFLHNYIRITSRLIFLASTKAHSKITTTVTMGRTLKCAELTTLGRRTLHVSKILFLISQIRVCDINKSGWICDMQTRIFDIRKSVLWYHTSTEFYVIRNSVLCTWFVTLMSQNHDFDITKSIFEYYKFDFKTSKIRFCNITNSWWFLLHKY